MEVLATRLGGLHHLSCKHDQIKMRDYMERRVTSPTWGPPPPCKQATRGTDISWLIANLLSFARCNCFFVFFFYNKRCFLDIYFKY